jgi:hypothetical protein
MNFQESTMYVLPSRHAPMPRSTLSTRAAVAGLVVLVMHIAGLFALDWLSAQALPASAPVSITSTDVSVAVDVQAAKAP